VWRDRGRVIRETREKTECEKKKGEIARGDRRIARARDLDI
jgi:hypothetical protein